MPHARFSLSISRSNESKTSVPLDILSYCSVLKTPCSGDDTYSHHAVATDMCAMREGLHESCAEVEVTIPVASEKPLSIRKVLRCPNNSDGEWPAPPSLDLVR